MKEDEDEDEDIEASIRKEISGMAATKDAPKMFQPVFLDVQCVLFFKLQPAIEPVDFVHRICEEAASNPTGRKHRFLNRLTPMTRMGRATQADLEALAREVLQKHFRLVDRDGTEGKAGESDAQDFCSVSFLLFSFRGSRHACWSGSFEEIMVKSGVYSDDAGTRAHIICTLEETSILTHHSMRSDQQSATTAS